MARPIAVVTGGARGIGRACAISLAQSGFDLVLVDLLEENLAQTQQEIRDEGAAVWTHVADVADYGAAQSIIGETLKDCGPITFLFNNAGRAMPKGLLEITEDEWDRTIDINLKSCFNWCQATVPSMLETAGGGRIVNMSSINALSGGVTSAVSKFAYAAAKSAILGLTRSLAKEFGPTIHVNALCPGLIKTERPNAVIRAREPELVKGIALNRVGTPSDIANIVTFLATVEPCFITGQHFVIDGLQWKL